MNTERLTIRIMQHSDVELARMLHNRDDVLENLTDPTYVNEERQVEWFRHLCTSNTSQRFAVYTPANACDPMCCPPQFVGVFRIDMLDYVNKSVMVGMDVAQEHRRKGYAKETYEYFLKYFFQTLGFNRVYLYVLETNPDALALYIKLGFHTEGRQRQAVFRHGRYVDYIMMSMLRAEYLGRKINDQVDTVRP